MAETEKTHYSAEELQEFKEIIEKKLAEEKAEYKNLRENMRSSSENSSDVFNTSDFGADMLDKEQIEMLLARSEKFINNLERALIRIQNGTYGRCKVTGKLIPKERLRVVPHTESTVEAKMNQNK